MTESSSTDIRLDDITENLKRIRENIAAAALKSGRTAADIKLMAVTKTVEPKYINHAISACGIDLIGENKVQELLSKAPYLELENVKVNIIGHLQSNKVKKIIPLVSAVQSVDSVHIAEALSEASVNAGTVTDILLEVNIGSEENKTGFGYDAVNDASDEIAALPGVTIRGLMAVPPLSAEKAELCKYFSNMYRLFVDIRAKKIHNTDIGVLSLGMTGDYAEAIENGSNLVRIGSGIFGARIY